MFPIKLACYKLYGFLLDLRIKYICGNILKRNGTTAYKTETKLSGFWYTTIAMSTN